MSAKSSFLSNICGPHPVLFAVKADASAAATERSFGQESERKSVRRSVESEALAEMFFDIRTEWVFQGVKGGAR
jgi:hypothetical protein